MDAMKAAVNEPGGPEVLKIVLNRFFAGVIAVEIGFDRFAEQTDKRGALSTTPLPSPSKAA
jgi:hypothetical protein